MITAMLSDDKNIFETISGYLAISYFIPSIAMRWKKYASAGGDNSQTYLESFQFDGSLG
jgi:hypothetical protein